MIIFERNFGYFYKGLHKRSITVKVHLLLGCLPFRILFYWLFLQPQLKVLACGDKTFCSSHSRWHMNFTAVQCMLRLSKCCDLIRTKFPTSQQLHGYWLFCVWGEMPSLDAHFNLFCLLMDFLSTGHLQNRSHYFWTCKTCVIPAVCSSKATLNMSKAFVTFFPGLKQIWCWGAVL
jgi:hypothetical protein